MKDKFSPGPWHWDDGWLQAEQHGYFGCEEREDSGLKFAALELFDANSKNVIPIRIDHYEIIYDGDPITPANRALIASAPDLLAALEELLEVAEIQIGITHSRQVNLARAALAKARNE